MFEERAEMTLSRITVVVTEVVHLTTSRLRRITGFQHRPLPCDSSMV